MTLLDIVLIAGAYLLGSLSTAIILCRLLGLPDPRSQGSGNPGATNILRFGGKKLAALTLVGDLAKGLIPVLIAKALDADANILAAVAMAAFLGHLYPIFFGFKGGKGVATAVGVLLGLSWPVALAALLTWLTMAAIFRISSLAAITAAVLSPFYMAWLDGRLPFIAMSLLMSLFLLWRHRSNIQRILRGEEKKIARK
ncbi:MAG: glycerol-3-phosphate 1-O-acyltransferase PlsY [Thiohalomonadaceae bacterium]